MKANGTAENYQNQNLPSTQRKIHYNEKPTGPVYMKGPNPT
jgi:hypothetical protein